jgi:hypothetical protein
LTSKAVIFFDLFDGASAVVWVHQTITLFVLVRGHVLRFSS